MISYISHPEDKTPPSRPPKPASLFDPAAMNALAGKRVVIVEDESITQMHLQKLLTQAGLQVAGYALDGEEGIATALRERPDIVLMDITMPGAIDGLEALRQILAQLSTCVVILTAYTHYKTEAEASGACGYIIKPIDSFTFLPQLAQAFQGWHKPKS